MTRQLLTTFFIALCFFYSGIAASAPEAEPWPMWTKHANSLNQKVDHSAWQQILDRYLSMDSADITRFDYVAVTDNASRALDSYLKRLQGTDVVKLTRAQQLAYWINLYNALTVSVVLDHYPVGSIRDIDISPGLFSNGPWGKRLLEINGETLSLNDIEHRILRPIWQDPRIHYAVNCASVSCPNLQGNAFTAENTASLLESAATSYVNHPRGVAFEGNELVVSSIYHWFDGDFGGSDPSVIEHLKRYAAPALAGRLATIGKISGHHYDWSLNAR